MWRDADELVLEDSGAGMTRRELEKGLGRVGASGTGDFAAAASALADSVGSGDAKALAQTSSIGRFGVGFYAAFLLAQRVSVVSLSAGAPDAPALAWESDGVDGYSIREATPDEEAALRENGGGTRVTLELRPDAANLAAERPLAAALRRYTPLLPFPVELRSAKGDWERLNPESSFWEAADDDDSADDAASALFGALYPKSGSASHAGGRGGYDAHVPRCALPAAAGRVGRRLGRRGAHSKEPSWAAARRRRRTRCGCRALRAASRRAWSTCRQG